MSETKACLVCAEQILVAAKKCKHCGEFLDVVAKENDEVNKVGESLGIIGFLIPIVSSFLIFFWIGQLSLFDDPGEKLNFLMLGTIIGTAILFAVEASKLGMVKKVDGKRTTGPIGWFLSMILIWAIAYPAYLYQRRKYGKKNYFFVG